MSRTDYKVKDYLDRCKSALDGLLNTHAQLTREWWRRSAAKAET